MKRTPTVLALACSLAVAGPGRAETVHTRLTPEKTGDHLRTFTVKVERHKDMESGKYLHVRVTVKPRPGKGPMLPRRTGTLEVYAGKKFISSCEVRPTGRDVELTYSFSVAARYAEKTKFTFAETTANPEGGGFYYWFYLTDFVEPAKPEGR